MPLPTSRSIRMMTSVSMLERMIGAATAVNFPNGFGISALHRPHIGDRAGNRCRHRTRGARQMGAGTRTLAADEVAVGGRDRALAGGYGFAIGRKAHRATRLAPFKAGLGENLVEAFGDRVAFDGLGARHDPGANAWCYLSPA